MSQPSSPLWNEMLDEFRKVGGIAENICLRQGHFGRGLFALDPSRPIKLHIPESLLVEVKQVEFENNVFRVGAAAPIGAPEKSFLENYEREFSWGVGQSETRELLQGMHTAPDELRQFLSDASLLERWLVQPTDVAVQERYLYSRCICYQGRQVVMPIVELANHGYSTNYVLRDGVGLEGTFPGEILVQYDACDPLEVFNRWGFVSEREPFALSLALALPNQALTIRREILEVSTERRPFFPDTNLKDGGVEFTYMLLGHRKFPRLPRGNFYRAMRDAGRSNFEEAFDAIQHINRMQLYRLFDLAESAPDQLRRQLQKLARCQLEAMSHHIGTREV